MVGLNRLIDIAADPESPAGPAVNASKFLVETALGSGGLGALQQALVQAERAGEPEPERSAVDEIKARLAAMHDAQADSERVLAAIEQSPSAGACRPP